MQGLRKNRKLIEVALPLDVINTASAREKSIRHGHPSTLHLWWARRPLAAARAVIFAQMVDDPSSNPETFPTKDAQDKERERLFELMSALVQWENTSNEPLLAQAREEIWKSWRRACADNSDNDDARGLFNETVLPGFHDPFAGGGALPLEAQRLGLDTCASDLNPVAVLINLGMIAIPPRFAGAAPVNVKAREERSLINRTWSGAQGLAEDVRFYGRWIRAEAKKRIGHLYPPIEVTADLVASRPDLKHLKGRKLPVVAWLWARTVRSPNPAFGNVDVPLVSTFMLSTKPGGEAYVEPIVEGDTYRFRIRTGQPQDAVRAQNGTKMGRGANFRCVMSGSAIDGRYIKAEGEAGRIGSRLMAIVAEGDRGRVYLPPDDGMELIARSAAPSWKPDIDISGSTQYLGIKPYGMHRFADIFTNRQLTALDTLSNLIVEAHAQIKEAAAAAGLEGGPGIESGGKGAEAYADAVSVYLSFALSKLADRGSTICTWFTERDSTRNTFSRQSIPMTWDYAELNTLLDGTGSFVGAVDWTAESIAGVAAGHGSLHGVAVQADARTQELSRGRVVSTDPPYYDNVPYADLSDFFYVWLRRSLRQRFPSLFATVTVPKSGELVAFAHRHKDKSEAREFFMNGMTEAMHRVAEQAHPAFPVTIYYAFKQSEDDGEDGRVSTGWQTFLEALIQAGFAINGTWPMRTELANRMRSMNANALASSIVLVCQRRDEDAPVATRREFISALKRELPEALSHLQRGNIAPVDLAQSAIGPGMAVYTRYAKVVDAEGRPLAVRDALAIINQTLDESLAEQEGDFDSPTRWAISWFEQFGFSEGDYGVAETLSKAKNTSVGGLVSAGIVGSRGGTVRLLQPAELSADWDPESDDRTTAWEIVHHLIRQLETKGEYAAAQLIASLGRKAEIGRELAYRLYALCDRKKRSTEALSYNALVQSWLEIDRLAREPATNEEPGSSQSLFENMPPRDAQHV